MVGRRLDTCHQQPAVDHLVPPPVASDGPRWLSRGRRVRASQTARWSPDQHRGNLRIAASYPHGRPVRRGLVARPTKVVPRSGLQASRPPTRPPTTAARIDGTATAPAGMARVGTTRRRQGRQYGSHLFAEQGYVATTIAAISDAAEIPAQTIYSAFGNKPAILREIARIWIAEADTRRLADEALPLEDPAERLRSAAHWQTRQFETGYDVIQHLPAGGRRPIARMAEEMRAIWDAREQRAEDLPGVVQGQARSTQRRSTSSWPARRPRSTGLSSSTERWPVEDYETWLGDTLVSSAASVDDRVVQGADELQGVRPCR